MYALQDPATKLYLTKNNMFKPLCSTTRYFQYRSGALRAISKRDTYFWIAYQDDLLGKPRSYRTKIDSPEFNKKIENWCYDRKLIITEIKTKEDTMNSNQQEMLSVLENINGLEYQKKTINAPSCYIRDYLNTLPGFMREIFKKEGIDNKIKELINIEIDKELKKLERRYNDLKKEI